ncbi:NADH-quinone oxidoreductase subunit M [Brevibacillus laterosporus]|uniref:complex I subunit 4 family protein n=1 Tax=Brevibacillus laterosporus TaxID=1465 RepID=UPI000BD77426|nr:NADH-quinone oxidoreductase subunit M [Brevibacillus laterosporus]PCN45416.1 NADH-quinone oxidoreductase subunit M [Brevibacillus laterosporus]
MLNSYLLSLLTFSPILALLILLFVPKQQVSIVKQIGVLGTLVPLILAFMMFGAFDYQQRGNQFEEHATWIQIPASITADQKLYNLHIDYEMGVDGISMPLILMTAIIGTLAAVASWGVKKRAKEYFVFFHLLLIGMFGVFAAQNLLLFFLFFEITLVAMYFLIGIWGYTDREKAANRFLLYNGVGSALMLVGFITLFFVSAIVTQEPTMSIPVLTEALTSPNNAFIEHVPETFRWGLFLVLFIAFGIKLPIFPFHTWMLRVHVQAPPAIVMIHSGILLKMGAYGLLRMGIGFFPETVQYFATGMAILGLVNILYGAALAFVQKDLKMVLAYSSISHMGIILLGFASMNQFGFQGALFQVISHGFISALMFFLVGIIWDRTGTSQLDQLGGLAKSMPFVSGVFLAAGMASLGLPGMSGFISEFFAFLGLFASQPVLAAIGSLGIIFTAVYVLRAVLAITYGPTNEKHLDLADAQPMEVIPIVVLLGFIILIGVYPAMLSNPLQETLKTIVIHVTGIGG